MVGRGGRSRGCLNCQRRKKGCDLVRPSCGQCTKRNAKCDGYSTDLAVVSYKPVAIVETCQRSLLASAMKIKYVDVFWEMFLPSASQPSQTSNGNWTQLIRDHCGVEDGPFNNALLAVTLSRVGQRNEDLRIARSGVNHYSVCLRQVVRALDRCDHASGHEIVATCLLLSLYEILCNPVSSDGWHNHIRGIATFMELCGPQAFTSGISHKIFASARLEMIFAATVFRKATFLNSHEWLSIPWSEDASPKSFYDRIVDLSAQMPQIFEMFDKTQNACPQIPLNLEVFLEACWKLDSDLQDWCRDFHLVYPESTDTFDRSKPSFTTPLTTESNINYENAQALSIYWAICVFLYATIRLIWQITDSPLYFLPPRIDPRAYAATISRSIPYFSGPNAGEGSLVSYALSLGAALHYLAACGESGSEDHRRIGSLISSKYGSVDIRSRVGIFLRMLANSSLDSPIKMDVRSDNELPETIYREKVIQMAQRWWGGGRDAITLPGIKNARVS